MTEAQNKVRLASGLLSAAVLLLEQAMAEEPSNELDRSLIEVRDAKLGVLAAQRPRVRVAQPEVEADATVQVTSGFLEASNVNAVEEMTAILSLSRQFELSVKMMRTAEDNSAAMARVLQMT